MVSFSCLFLISSKCQENLGTTTGLQTPVTSGELEWGVKKEGGVSSSDFKYNGILSRNPMIKTIEKTNDRDLFQQKEQVYGRWLNNRQYVTHDVRDLNQ